MMTAAQRAHFFSHLWPRACEAMGWDPQNDTLRHTFFRAEGLPESFRDFSQAHFDSLKAKCLAIARPSDLAGQLRMIDQPRARWEAKIREHLRCLARYHPAPQDYDAALRRSRFRGQSMADMDLRDLGHYCITLNARINGARGLRAAAGESVQTMRRAVGL